MIRKVGVALAETLAAAIGLVGVLLFGVGVLLCKLAQGIYEKWGD